jgi:hypothetical protein
MRSRPACPGTAKAATREPEPHASRPSTLAPDRRFAPSGEAVRGAAVPGAVSATMTGITGRSGWRKRKSRTSSLTAGRVAAPLEQRTISAAEASSALTVASPSLGPPGKSSRSLKIGRSVLPTPGRAARSLSNRSLQGSCAASAEAASLCAEERNARCLSSIGRDMVFPPDASRGDHRRNPRVVGG